MKEILVNFDKCTGCRCCELVCSLEHGGAINPKKSRIKVIRDVDKALFYPIIAGPYTDAECSYKYPVILGGKEYGRCDLCRASCPSRAYFKEPDTGVALKCDMCGDPPKALCVEFCTADALSLIEIEEKSEGQKQEEEEFEEVF